MRSSISADWKHAPVLLTLCEGDPNEIDFEAYFREVEARVDELPGLWVVIDTIETNALPGSRVRKFMAGHMTRVGEILGDRPFEPALNDQDWVALQEICE